MVLDYAKNGSLRNFLDKNYKYMDTNYWKCIQQSEKNYEGCNLYWAMEPWRDYVNKKKIN